MDQIEELDELLNTLDKREDMERQERIALVASLSLGEVVSAGN